MKQRTKSGLLLIAGLGFILSIFTLSAVTALADLGDPEIFQSPIGDVSVPEVLTKVVNWLLSFVAILAMLGLVWGAIMFIISLGNESGIQRAKKIVLWSVIGLAVALLSFLIIQFVAGILGVRTA